MRATALWPSLRSCFNCGLSSWAVRPLRSSRPNFQTEHVNDFIFSPAPAAGWLWGFFSFLPNKSPAIVTTDGSISENPCDRLPPARFLPLRPSARAQFCLRQKPGEIAGLLYHSRFHRAAPCDRPSACPIPPFAPNRTGAILLRKNRGKSPFCPTTDDSIIENHVPGTKSVSPILQF